MNQTIDGLSFWFVMMTIHFNLMLIFSFNLKNHKNNYTLKFVISFTLIWNYFWSKVILGPTSVTQTNTLVPATTVSSYTIGSGTYFYDASASYPVSRSFGHQSSSFTTVTQTSQPIRSTVMGTQVRSEYLLLELPSPFFQIWIDE